LNKTFFFINQNQKEVKSMALMETTSNEIENTDKKEKEQEFTYRVFPDISRRIDYDHNSIEIEVSLPGVSKSAITLKALPEIFHIEGKREHMLYSGNYAWGAEVVPEKTTAKYENGLLRIHAVIRNAMDDAKEVAL